MRGRKMAANLFAMAALAAAACIALGETVLGPSETPEAYFNGTAYIRMMRPISLHSHVGISFRSCVGGEIFTQRFENYSVHLSALPDSVLFTFKSPKPRTIDVRLPLRSLDNRWHYVGLVYQPPNLVISDESGHSTIVANNTYNSEILNVSGLEGDSTILIVGNSFSGCMLEGPSLVFNSSFLTSSNVRFGKCPLTTEKCVDRRDIIAIAPIDHCYNEPCMRHGVCISKPDRYECRCAFRYAGNNCQIDNGPPCGLKVCMNSAVCEETKEGNYTCICTPDYYGDNCEYEVSHHPLCAHNPCLNNGTCQVEPNDNFSQCICKSGFTGVNCEINIDDCAASFAQPPCLNGGVCQDGIDEYTCDCSNTGFSGTLCEVNINECDLQPGPCLNRGVCFDTYGSYVCHCQPGYTGNNCQLNQDECLSSPCLNGGTCIDIVGSYKCNCPSETTGPRCNSLRRSVRCVDSDCPPHSKCANHSTSTLMCICNPGYSGVPGPSPNCTPLYEMECPNNMCLNGGSCTLAEDAFNCTCPVGYTGVRCELPIPLSDVGPSPRSIVRCADLPCVHSISCEDYSGGYFCNCEPGWTGANCETYINECTSNPCQNGGECIHSANTFHCRCPPGFTGRTCQTAIDLCSSHPCQNGGSCTHMKNNMDYVCECPLGFEGAYCEKNINDCQNVTCPEFQVCYDGIDSYTCRCPDGFTGDNCTIPTDYCASSPCVNGTCKEGGGSNNYICTCHKGYTGRNCETDIDECKVHGICNQGICRNEPGSYQCYCKPGFTGEHCDVDFDECLSRPCRNNGSCVNKINDYECICTPGFTGKDCSININECESNPCMEGSTCVDGLATFTCLCMQGLTGPTCEVNIDDCESSPCLNGGLCLDGLNNYTCNCTDTGHKGPNCQYNIDDCASNPCVHGSVCVDLIKDYECKCHPGYTGKNCDIDIQECESSPCQYRGICLERSNVSLYQNISYDPINPIYINEELNMLLPLHFFQEFNYENASGFECVCISGITGSHCEININECESSPCSAWGTCVDRVGRYDCECEEGFEGDHCQKDIDECARYKPCMHGVCHDRRANYYCECEQGWGGKNCSVELLGCSENHCLNDGTCLPWLYGETDHKFNCTCTTGYYGRTCEKITTMSLGGHSYVAVNTTRDEGYDIQFRFKTTLGNGLLAIGKGLTFYILELVNGRLNLRSSLLNKWEGVFIGSTLNNSKWQKVFVAINSSHLVLAANEEQTIYPILINEANNSSHTSFPTTYLGGTINTFSRLSHGPAAFIGCVEDVIINGEWVLPNDSPAKLETTEVSQIVVDPEPVTLSTQTASWLLYGVQARCPRVDQCGPLKNPCHSGGVCTDLWTSFHCSCQRPYLGHTCQYNVTAATFGHENITNSLVTVLVNDNARRAVRSIVDISMFIRTRKPSGQIFYLGSNLAASDPYSEETFIAASLENGELFVRLQFNQTSEAYAVGGSKLDNGFNHLIQVVRNSTLVQVKLNGSEYFRKPIPFTGQLEAQVLHLGGQPILTPSRAIRQADISLQTSVGSSGISVVHGNLRSEPGVAVPYINYPQPDYFKGIIQDVQISNGSRTMIVEFFPLHVPGLEMPLPFGTVSFDNSTILEGVISDDSCAGNPCTHNGTCQITWNDFRCTCPRGYKGKSCQEIEFCQLQDCPIGSACRNLDDGYECIANATFDGHNTTFAYNLTSIDSFGKEEKALVANSILIEYRSKTGGTLLHIENTNTEEMVSISVFRDQVTFSWRLSHDGVPKVGRFRKSQPDFEWTQIHLVIVKNRIKGGFGDWLKDDSPAFTSEFDYESWIKLLESAEIHLGGVRLSKENSIETSSAFTTDEFARNYTQGGKSLFALDRTLHSAGTTRRLDFQNDGLISGNNVDLFTFDPTEPSNGHDFWTENEGSIGGNFKGCLGEVRIGDLLLPFYTLAELYPDVNLLQPGRRYFSLETERPDDAAPLGCILCFDRDCLNGGRCAEPENDYLCSCPSGYAGDDCSIDVDECIDSRCGNNSTCIDGVGNYTCTCSSGWDGWLCDVDIDECASQPCKNGGSCTDLPGSYRCDCLEEFTGENCASPRLVTCAHHPCRAGSTCTDQKDTVTGYNFTCSCMPGFEGALCDIPYCIVKPCLNGGMCENLPDSMPVCKCPPGFNGKFCEINIDECHLADGTSPCLHGSRCIDGIASYTCDCTDTGYYGTNCEIDIDECDQGRICGDGGTCINQDGSYTCACGPNKCGNNCSLQDPCSIARSIETHHRHHVTDGGDNIASEAYTNSSTNPAFVLGPCDNGGTCTPMCKTFADYECKCIDGWGGKNCTERSVVAAKEEGPPVGIIVGAVVGGLCALVGIGLTVTCMLARSKRATRGTYSPSGQEYRNPRLEMLDNVLKPPPEERLI